MNAYNQNGFVEEEVGQTQPRYESWANSAGYSPAENDSILPALQDTDRDSVELRLAILARAIDHEIIPRLMLAHRGSHACLVPQAESGLGVNAADVEEFAKLVLSPDENVAHACIEAMRARGISVETIYLDLLAPVARYLGELWEQDLCDFTEVTLGLGRLHRVLRELSPAFSQPNDRPSNGRRVLLLPGMGEQHTFGLVMVAEFFRRAGWDVAGGPWEAGADPVVMVKREWFDVVGFSLASELHLDALGECIRKVREAALNPSLRILVGGPAFAANPDYVSRVHADAATNDGSKAPDVAERLVASSRRQG